MTLHWVEKSVPQLPSKGSFDRYQCQSLRPHSAWRPMGGAATYCAYNSQAFSMNRDILSIHRIRKKMIKKLSFRFVIPESCSRKNVGL